MKENDKRDLKVIYQFARDHCDEIGLNTVDTINCNYVRLEERLTKLDQLENDCDVLEKTNKFINDMAEKQSKELSELKEKGLKICDAWLGGKDNKLDDLTIQFLELVGEDDE